MKCWVERPEHRPTFTQQIKDLSTILELQAGYLNCFTNYNGMTTSNDAWMPPSSDGPSGEERDAVIDPLSNKKGAPTDDNMTAHTRGDGSVSPRDFVERKCESSGDECGGIQ